MDHDEPIPSTITRDAPTPWARVVRALRSEARDQGVPARALLDLLECTKQDLCDWCSTSRRAPPLWVVRRLCARLGFVVVLTPDEVRLVPRSDVHGLDPT